MQHIYDAKDQTRDDLSRLAFLQIYQHLCEDFTGCEPREISITFDRQGQAIFLTGVVTRDEFLLPRFRLSDDPSEEYDYLGRVDGEGHGVQCDDDYAELVHGTFAPGKLDPVITSILNGNQRWVIGRTCSRGQ